MRGGSGRGAGYDPINKTGLLPRDGRRQVDGVSTYVLAGNTSSSGSKRPRPGQPGGGFAMPSEQRNKEDVAERKRRREAEEKMLSRVLKKDDNRSMGARYLNRNKPPTNSTSTDSEEGDSAGNDADSKKKSRKRAFDATQLRAIGYDPTNRTDTLVHLGEDAKTKKQRVSSFFYSCFVINC